MSRYYYTVKNVSTADKAAADNPGEITGTLGSDSYDLLTYSAPYTFDGTEDNVEELTYNEARNASISPVFVDYSAKTFQECRDAIGVIVGGEEKWCRQIMNYMGAIYLQNYGTWTDAQKASFSLQLRGVAAAMAQGSLPIMKYELSLFVNTGDLNYTAPIAPLTATMCSDAMAEIDKYLLKAPR